MATSGSTSSPYLFAATSGYRNDNDDGLMLVGARYYDPAVGLFITRDTDLSQPAYQYCNDDPINAVDPSGHDSESEGVHILHELWIGLFSAIGGGIGASKGGLPGGIIGTVGGILVGEGSWYIITHPPKNEGNLVSVYVYIPPPPQPKQKQYYMWQ